MQNVAFWLQRVRTERRDYQGKVVQAQTEEPLCNPVAQRCSKAKEIAQSGSEKEANEAGKGEEKREKRGKRLSIVGFTGYGPVWWPGPA